MPSKKFVNPLLRSTAETATESSTETSTLPSTAPSTYTYTSTQVTHRKRGEQSFEKTHERITLWIDKGLKQRFEAMAEEQGKAKSTLLDEAIAAYLEGDPRLAALEAEIKQLKERLDIETRVRLHTKAEPFQQWLRSHPQPQESSRFFQRFLDDPDLPSKTSRSGYIAHLRTHKYSAEDIALFEEAWKDMLFTQGESR